MNPLPQRLPRSSRLFAEEIAAKPETVGAVSGSSIAILTNRDIKIRVPDVEIRCNIVDNHLLFYRFSGKKRRLFKTTSGEESIQESA